jgi:predicted permease
MKTWSRLRSSLQGLFRRSRLESEMETELRFHIDAYIEDLVRSGVPREEASRRARLEFGGLGQVKEECRDARGTRWLQDLLQDFRYAIHILTQKPGFAAVTLLTLALGTGATTVMFTVVNGVLLKPMPYSDPARLVEVQEKTDWSTDQGDRWAFAYPNYVDCKRETSTLDMTAWRYNGGTVTGEHEAEYVDGYQISSDLFSVLGVAPERGRAFLPKEDRVGATPVMMISDGLWERLFARDPAAIGMTLVFDGKSYAVVGIMPPGFRVNEDAGDIFTPLGQENSPGMQNRARHPGIMVVARLRSRVQIGDARNELALIGRNLAKQFPESNKGRTFIADSLRPDVGDVGSTLWLLLGAVSLVLLIACANVASLLLARAVSRDREFAMRVALGASRGRVVRQCLTESAVLGLSGGLLGVLIAALGIGPFLAFWPGTLPRAQDVSLDWRVLLFAVGVSLASGLLFGLAPALRIPSRGIEHALRSGGRAIAGSSRRLHASFVVSEIALAVVLLVAAGMLGRTLLRLSSLNPGVDSRNVLVTRMSLPPSALANPAQTRAAWRAILDDARAVPGVKSVAIVDTFPMRQGYNQAGFSTSPSLPSPDRVPLALATSVTPEYRDVMGIPLLKGRFFDDNDRLGNELVVVIDDVFAQQAFGAENPVGKRLWLPGNGSPFSSGGDAPDVVRVVGVVGHVRHWGLANDDQAQVRAQFYYPFAQVPDPLVRRWSELMSIAVRTNVPPLSLLQPLRQALRGSTGDQVLYEVRTMEQLVSASIARQRFLMLLFGIFAGLALLLACVGIYGVLAYLTGQRVAEIGVRIALGATRANVIWLVLRQSLGMIAVGVALGMTAALAAGRVLSHLVDGMRPTELSTFALTVFVLASAALLASFLPALRASRVDPMRALRQE